jgi:hypothetical protein
VRNVLRARILIVNALAGLVVVVKIVPRRTLVTTLPSILVASLPLSVVVLFMRVELTAILVPTAISTLAASRWVALIAIVTLFLWQLIKLIVGLIVAVVAAMVLRRATIVLPVLGLTLRRSPVVSAVRTTVLSLLVVKLRLKVVLVWEIGVASILTRHLVELLGLEVLHFSLAGLIKRSALL